MLTVSPPYIAKVIKTPKNPGTQIRDREKATIVIKCLIYWQQQK